jgi:hypothetical protein
VRIIALAAAAAWAREAEDAEALESGSGPGPKLSDEDAEIAREFLMDEDTDHELERVDPDHESKE